MYKITLMDENMPAFVSFVTVFFTDNIETFKKEWLRLESNESRKQRFIASLGGKLVTDYYADDEEYNIVQEDKNAKIIFRKKYSYDRMRAYNLKNSWDYEKVALADKSTFFIRGIEFKGEYYLVGKYKLSGVCQIDPFSYNLRLKYVYANGNRVLKTKQKSIVEFEKGVPLYDVTDFSNFKDDVITSICYIPMKWFKTREELLHFVNEAPIEGLFPDLMRDIPGESG